MTVRFAAALVLVVLGARFVVNANAFSGPVVMTLTRTHGLHANDGITLALWIAAARLIEPMSRVVRSVRA